MRYGVGTTRGHRGTRTGSARRGALALLTVAALGTAPTAAVAAPATEPRGIDQACDDGAQQAAPFADVPADAAYADAVSCLAAYDVVAGRFEAGSMHFDGDLAVDRQQLATFVANTLGLLPAAAYQPPAATVPEFRDVERISDVHRVAVARLQADEMIGGYADGTFRPGETVTRGQMASFVVGALEAVTGPLPAPADAGESAHADSAAKLAAIGVGVDGALADPATRAEMATYLARGLDHLAAEGHFVRMDYAPQSGDARRGLTDVDAVASDAGDRVTFDLGAGEGDAGWHIRYVEEARSHGTGDAVAVRGDAVLEVVLTGMALPTTLDVDTWSGDRIAVDGPGIVDVVDVGVYEGRHLLFVGTTGRHAFTADTGDTAHEIHLDVTPG